MVVAEDCTGLTAKWCPNHGRCECSPGHDLADDSCQLHNRSSDHPLAPLGLVVFS